MKIKMAMISQLVVLSLTVQSLLAATTPTMISVVVDSTEIVTESSTASKVVTPAPTTSSPTTSNLSTQGSTNSTSTELAATASTNTTNGTTTTNLGSTEALSTVLTTAAPSLRSTESGTTATAGGGTTTTTTRTEGMTTTMPPAVTSESTSGQMTTLMLTTGGAGSDGVSLAVYIGAGVAVGLLMLIIIFAIGCWCVRRRGRSKSGDGRRNPFGPDEVDEEDFKSRFSMHRPASATVEADDDLAFVTFSTGQGAASAEYHVAGIENPTYDLGPPRDEMDKTAGEKDQDQNGKTAGEEGQDMNGAATMPSPARLSVSQPVEGDVKNESEASSASNMRPQSGVSYTSNDIDGALETLEIGTV